MSLKFCRNSRCIYYYMRAIKLKTLFMLLKIDFISSRQPITAKFEKLREIATAIIRVQNFNNPDLFSESLDKIYSVCLLNVSVCLLNV